MSCSRLLSTGAWRSLLQAVSLPASWSPACSHVQAHGVLRALCSLATGHAEPLSRDAATHGLTAAHASHDAWDCNHTARDATKARTEVSSTGLWSGSRSGVLPAANLLQFTHRVRTTGVQHSKSRSLSSSAADRDVHAQDGSPIVEDALGDDVADDGGVALAMERIILEAYRLMQAGHPQQAEYLLIEGVNSFSEELGDDAAALSQLWDQLALLQFIQEKLVAAEEAVLRSLDATVAQYGADSTAAAMCDLRLGTIRMALGRAAEAEPLLRSSHAALREAFGDEFEAVGEAGFYLTLAALGRTPPQDIPELNGQLHKALMAMRSNKGAGPMLALAALREHGRLRDSAIEAEDWPRVEALFEQALWLQRRGGASADGAVSLLYQYATVQYVRGEHAAAKMLAEEALQKARELYHSLDEQVQLQALRLGTCLLGLGRSFEAEKLLQTASDRFTARLGPDNPVSSEARLAVAIANVRQLLPFQAVEARQLRQEAAVALADMRRGFQPDHMLVRKAEKLFADQFRGGGVT